MDGLVKCGWVRRKTNLYTTININRTEQSRAERSGAERTGEEERRLDETRGKLGEDSRDEQRNKNNEAIQKNHGCFALKHPDNQRTGDGSRKLR